MSYFDKMSRFVDVYSIRVNTDRGLEYTPCVVFDQSDLSGIENFKRLRLECDTEFGFIFKCEEIKRSGKVYFEWPCYYLNTQQMDFVISGIYDPSIGRPLKKFVKFGGQ